MLNNKLVFLDTETTGNNTKQDRLCQICYKFEDEKNEKGEVINKGKIVTKNFKPPVPISVKAMSVTHITNKMVENEENFKNSQTAIELQNILDNNILVAHNAKFDIAILEAEGISVSAHICTLRLARYLDKESEIPEYSLQFLRYYYEIEIEARPHSAEGDVVVLEAVFEHLYKKAQRRSKSTDREIILKRMIEISAQPSLIKKFTFGKYSGRSVAEIAMEDRSYLEWLCRIKKEEDDEDWIYTLEYYLKK